MSDKEQTSKETQPMPILGITVGGDILLPAGLRQADILTLLNRLNAGVKQRLDNLVVS